MLLAENGIAHRGTSQGCAYGGHNVGVLLCWKWLLMMVPLVDTTIPCIDCSSRAKGQLLEATNSQRNILEKPNANILTRSSFACNTIQLHIACMLGQWTCNSFDLAWYCLRCVLSIYAMTKNGRVYQHWLHPSWLLMPKAVYKRTADVCMHMLCDTCVNNIHLFVSFLSSLHGCLMLLGCTLQRLQCIVEPVAVPFNIPIQT